MALGAAASSVHWAVFCWRLDRGAPVGGRTDWAVMGDVMPQCAKQCGESKTSVFSLKQIAILCFFSHDNPRMME